MHSGVARLGHTGARALATGGHAHQRRYAPESSALIVPLSIANRALSGLQIEWCSIATQLQVTYAPIREFAI